MGKWSSILTFLSILQVQLFLCSPADFAVYQLVARPPYIYRGDIRSVAPFSPSPSTNLGFFEVCNVEKCSNDTKKTFLILTLMRFKVGGVERL